MFHSKTQYGRMAEFREKLDLNKSEMAERLGLKQRAYAFYEAGERKIPPEVLERLAAMGLNLNWLSTGQGEMLAVAGSINVTVGSDTMQAFGMVGEVTGRFPEREVIRATELAYRALGTLVASPAKMGMLIAIIAQMLVQGKAEAEILEEAAPVAKTLAHLGVGNQSSGNPGRLPSG